MTRRTIIFSVIGIALIVYVAIVAANPLRRSEETIEVSLRKTTPLGSTSEEVVRAFAKKGLFPEVDSVGVYKQKIGTKAEVIGVASIRVLLGEYRTPFVTSVSAFFAFDANARLIDVWVWKTVDAL
jgi:hypothetical protein